jgi:hypothetical protein
MALIDCGAESIGSCCTSQYGCGKNVYGTRTGVGRSVMINVMDVAKCRDEREGVRHVKR